MPFQDLAVGGTSASAAGSELSGLQNFLANPGQSILDFVGLDWINTSAIEYSAPNGRVLNYNWSKHCEQG